MTNYRTGPGLARVIRKPTPQIIPDATVEVVGGGGTGGPEGFDAEEALTDLGEQEAAAESENETAELDSVNEVPPTPVNPRFPDEAAPVSHSGGSID